MDQNQQLGTIKVIHPKYYKHLKKRAHPKNLQSENNNPWFKPRFDILLQLIVCATVDSHCLEYLGYINLGTT